MDLFLQEKLRDRRETQVTRYRRSTKRTEKKKRTRSINVRKRNERVYLQPPWVVREDTVEK